jgi:threonine aldolase
VQSNIVIFDLLDGAPDAAGFTQKLAGHGVKMSIVAARTVRAVTHHGIEAAHVEQALAAVAQVMG